jgi:hypothetical protein
MDFNKVLDIILFITNTTQLVVFIIFIFKLTQLLRRNKEAKLSKFIIATLLCIGFSIFLLQFNTAYLIFNGEYESNQSKSYISGYTNQFFEKVGIMIDIAGISIELLKDKYNFNPKKY